MGGFRTVNLIIFKNLYKDESGQATVEYILLLSVIVFGVSQIGRAVIGALDRGILFLGAQLEKDLKTGRAQINVWKN